MKEGHRSKVSSFIILKIELEEAKRMKEVMTSQLIEGEGHCERLKVEIVSFRNDLEKTNE